MKPFIKQAFVRPMLLAALGSVLDGQAAAQTFTTLHSDGPGPSGLTLSGNTLYGTASGGGEGSGTVFALNTDGTGFVVLHTFRVVPVSFPFTNSGGAYPLGGLILSGNALYGTTMSGGSGGSGTVFKVNTDGTDFTILYSFTASYTGTTGDYTNYDGAAPGGLILSSSTLYGTTVEGGISGYGTVFKLNTDGTGFMTLHIFDGPSGMYPRAPLSAR